MREKGEVRLVHLERHPKMLRKEGTAEDVINVGVCEQQMAYGESMVFDIRQHRVLFMWRHGTRVNQDGFSCIMTKVAVGLEWIKRERLDGHAKECM